MDVDGTSFNIWSSVTWHQVGDKSWSELIMALFTHATVKPLIKLHLGRQ